MGNPVILLGIKIPVVEGSYVRKRLTLISNWLIGDWDISFNKS